MTESDRSIRMPRTPRTRTSLFLLFLLFGIVVFAVPAVLPDAVGAVVLAAALVGFLLALFRRRRTAGSQDPQAALCLAFGAAALVNLLGTAPFALGLVITNRDQLLEWQLLRTLFAVVVILAFTGFSRESLGSIYLRKGRLVLGLGIGLGAFAFFYLTAPSGAHLVTGQSVTFPTVVALSAWLFPFVLSNGLREELLFRGLFLSKYDALLGPRIANVLQAAVFSLSHLGEVYTASLLFFLVETLILGLILGFLMQRTKSLLGSALAHAGTDVPIVVVLLTSFVAP